jgi:hypothetical protein
MRIRWAHRCWICEAPLNVSFLFDHEHELDWVLSWHMQKPLDLSSNTTVYKAFGLKFKRLCVSCYEHQKAFNACQYLAQREVDGQKAKPHEYQSMSEAEIDTWIREAVSYSKDPKADFYKAPLTLMFMYWSVFPGLYWIDRGWSES